MEKLSNRKLPSSPHAPQNITIFKLILKIQFFEVLSEKRGSMKMKLTTLPFILSLLSLSFQSWAQGAKPTCISAFGKRSFPKIQVADAQGKSHFQFGLEVEYTSEDSKKLLELYMPDPEISGVSRAKWQKMSHEEKTRFINFNKPMFFPKNRTEGRFLKLKEDPGYDYLPESFLADAGNFEIRVGPFDSYEEWKHAVAQINQELSPGSMQASVSVSEGTFFGGSYPVEENMAYFKAIHEHDTMEKLHKGFQKLQKSPESMSAKSFDHPWLGPDDSAREGYLLEALTRNAKGDYKKVKEIGEKVSSHKFMGGTVYRPDVAVDARRIVNEVRDCHKDFRCLEERVRRIMTVHQKGKESFLAANDFLPFQRESSLYTLSELTREVGESSSDVAKMLRNLYPRKPSNFAYPVRDWSGHVKVLEEVSERLGVDLGQSIEKAKTAYIKKLQRIELLRQSEQITPFEAKQQIQAALVRFSEESRIYEVLEAWMTKKLGTAA